MNKSLLIFCFIILAASNLFCQSISGTIEDNLSQPVIFANVVLYAQQDSSITKVETTDDEGSFSISAAPGAYYLEVSYIGLENLSVSDINLQDNDIDLGQLQMTTGGIELETAVVTAQRALVEVKSDRTVFNVEGTINSTGDDGLGLLRKAPGVLIDNNNNITVLGRTGVLFYVDGKRLPLAGEELAAFLQSIPADQIDRMDIITNPGAKYEAEGNAGIIDIRMKRDKSLGFNGSISVNASQGIAFRGNVSSLLNYRSSKFNAYGTLGYNLGTYVTDIIFDSSQNGFRQLGINNIDSDRNGENIRFGTDFYVAPKHTIGFLINRSNNGGDFVDSNRNLISTDLVTNFGDETPEDVIIPIDNIDSVLVASQFGNTNTLRQTYNLNYTFSDGPQFLSLDADYGKFSTTQSSSQPNTYFNNVEDEIINRNDFAFNTPITIDIYTGKIDYENNLGTGKFGTGAKYSRISTDNLFEFNNVVNDILLFNDTQSNRFFYDESVYAGYVTYSQSLNEKWNLSTGLRAELTETLSELVAFRDELQEPARDSTYVSLFPSIGLTYAATPANVWSISLGRRINRPDYNVLNPFRIQSSELDFSIGNPALSPEIVNNIELGYTLNYRYNFKLAYSLTTNQITRLIGTDDSDPKASFINWDNLAEQRVLGFSASLPFQFGDNWTTFVNASANYTDNQATYPDGNVIDLQAFTYNIFQQHTYKLPRGFVAELSSWFSGPGIWGGVFRYRSSYAINLGLQKRFLQERLNVKLAIQDITNQAFWNGVSEFDGLLSFGQGNWDNRRASVSVTYSFGSSEVKASRKRSIGLEAESDRIEN